jgi:hypothetical protein
MDPKFIIERQGKKFVLYEGLLNEAHQEGLCRISTTLVQAPHPDNDNTAIVSAEVETSKGVFSGIGDANSGNVGRPIAPHIIRMAETRAKARAMRDAVNIGVTSLEELGDFNHESDDTPDGMSAGDSPRDATPASSNQLATVAKLSRLLGRPEEPHPDMTWVEASERITDLSREYNERKGTGRRSA